MFCFHWRVLSAGLLLAGSSVPLFSADKCRSLTEQLRADVAARPERVLIFVEDAMVQNELCACEIVKVAIMTTKAPPKLVAQIVHAAVEVSPGAASIIAECAIAAAPEAAPEVQVALKQALGTLPPPQARPLRPVSSKTSAGKGQQAPAPPSDAEEWDAGTAPAVNISGIYLVFPGGGSSSAGIPRQGEPKIIVRRPRSPKPLIIIRPAPVSPTAADYSPSQP